MVLNYKIKVTVINTSIFVGLWSWFLAQICDCFSLIGIPDHPDYNYVNMANLSKDSQSTEVVYLKTLHVNVTLSFGQLRSIPVQE